MDEKARELGAMARDHVAKLLRGVEADYGRAAIGLYAGFLFMELAIAIAEACGQKMTLDMVSETGAILRGANN